MANRLFDNSIYDNAIIGISTDDRLVYDYEGVISCYTKSEIKENMNENELDDLYNETVDMICHDLQYIAYMHNIAPIVIDRHEIYELDESESSKLLKGQDNAFVGVYTDEGKLVYNIDKIGKNCIFEDCGNIIFIRGI